MGVYEDITNRIVSAIETGAATPEGWRMPWHGAPTGGRPSNVASGKAYQGINTLNLWIEAQARGYGSPVWGTLKQWNAAGAKVRRGEKAAPVVFWKDLPKRDANQEGEEGDRRFVLKTSAVFNAAQVEGWEGTPVVPVDGPTAHAGVLHLVDNARMDIRFEGYRAFYHTILDFVSVPPPSVFFTQAGFASTLLHEACHWTGHKARMNREFGKRFGDGAYAMEELVAELGAAFLCADLGVENEPRDDHASYIAGWLRVLKSDPRAIFTAATQATKAAEYLFFFNKMKKKARRDFGSGAFFPISKPEQNKEDDIMTAIISGQGRIAKVGEVRAAGNSEVLEARVAVDNGWGDKRKTDFLTLKIWNAQARTMESRLKIGGQVFFSGEFSTNEWGNEGAKKLDLQVRVNILELIGPRDAAGSDDRRAAGAGSTYPTGRQAAGGSAAVTDIDDEIPF